MRLKYSNINGSIDPYYTNPDTLPKYGYFSPREKFYYDIANTDNTNDNVFAPIIYGYRNVHGSMYKDMPWGEFWSMIWYTPDNAANRLYKAKNLWLPTEIIKENYENLNTVLPLTDDRIPPNDTTPTGGGRGTGTGGGAGTPPPSTQAGIMGGNLTKYLIIGGILTGFYYFSEN